MSEEEEDHRVEAVEVQECVLNALDNCGYLYPKTFPFVLSAVVVFADHMGFSRAELQKMFEEACSVKT